MNARFPVSILGAGEKLPEWFGCAIEAFSHVSPVEVLSSVAPDLRLL